MATYIALLRAVNVGGTGKLPMARLKALCEQLGFTQVRTVIASGNVILASRLGPAQVQSRLAAALHEEMGKPVGVLVRGVDEMRAVLAAQPFGQCDGARCHVIFLDGPAPAAAAGTARNLNTVAKLVELAK